MDTNQPFTVTQDLLVQGMWYAISIVNSLGSYSPISGRRSGGRHHFSSLRFLTDHIQSLNAIELCGLAQGED